MGRDNILAWREEGWVEPERQPELARSLLAASLRAGAPITQGKPPRLPPPPLRGSYPLSFFVTPRHTPVTLLFDICLCYLIAFQESQRTPPERAGTRLMFTHTHIYAERGPYAAACSSA